MLAAVAVCRSFGFGCGVSFLFGCGLVLGCFDSMLLHNISILWCWFISYTDFRTHTQVDDD